MKNLPEKFPIRYAIVINDWYLRAQGYDVEMQKKIVSQIINDVKKNPLTIERPFFDFFKVTAGREKMDLLRCSFLKRQDTDDNEPEYILPYGMDEMCDGIEKMLGGDDVHINITQEDFSIGLYSYFGACEIPLIYKIIKKDDHQFFKELALIKDSLYTVPQEIREESKKKSRHVKFVNSEKGTETDIEFIKKVKEMYHSFTLGELKKECLEKEISKYPKPKKIEAPFSNLWKNLDNRQQDGCLPSLTLAALNKMNKDVKYEKKKIDVLIFGSWKSLVLEELSELYILSRFCKNCYKILPTNWQGNYCPDKENSVCKKERARLRANKYRVTKNEKNVSFK